MGTSRFEPSAIKNKIKREEVSRKNKKSKRQEKLQTRLARAKIEAADPAAKKKRLTQNVPRTLDNSRDFDATMVVPQNAVASTSSTSELTSDPQPSSTPSLDETATDIASDPFAEYFLAMDPTVPPKVLITTSPKACKATYEFCDELVSVIPGSEFIRRKKGKGFEIGKIAGWAAGRGYSNMIVVNEDHKNPNAITVIHLPAGPTAYFKLTSVQLTSQISGHARATSHYPELVLNNFVTRLGHTVGRMFQTLFPAMPEFQGRQVVTLHNQRDFLFFRRHRYAFRSTEKAALQEIGPRFTLKLRWMKKNFPAVQNLGDPAKPLELAVDEEDEDSTEEAADVSREEAGESQDVKRIEVRPGTDDEYIWMWKPDLETTRKTFFL